VIFAAAGNEGKNRPVYWPAILEGEIIRINSTDRDGMASSFNPHLTGSKRICTLGEGVPSCEKDTENKIVYRNGTSFATPIAVAIAAIVLGFMDEVAKDVAREEAELERSRSIPVPRDFPRLMKRLRTKSGIEAILTEICVEQPVVRTAHYSYITPWYFLEADGFTRVGTILNQLRNVPE
jgi:hypothetical protein